MNSFRSFQAEPSDWDKLPLIYEADCYFMAAGLMRRGAAQELDEHARGDRLLYLAADGDQVIGTVGLVFRGPSAGYADGVESANIHRLHVVKSHRRLGIATALMEAATGEAARRGYSRLTVEVEGGNPPAQLLYQGLGFRYTGRTHQDQLELCKLL